ncbi:hypothetical protein ABEU98_30720 [Priestia megaterium]|uniref:hypothetical protein n=1 Tax=Priestia TaxID=2800373 RepID=UPI00188EFC4E|nr:hypothetical protein [Priestia megaterium]MED4035793.1 hypothetical protein [Priestia megaterium]
MKKILLTSMVSTLCLGLVSPAFAAESNQSRQSVSSQLDQENTEPEYTYTYNGIEFTGNYELTTDELRTLYVQSLALEAKTTSPSDDVSVEVNDPGTGQVQVVKPYYRTYTNKTQKEVANAITSYLLSKIPSPVKGNVVGIWVVGKITQWTNVIKQTYVGSWITSSYVTSKKKRVYHATLVHYKNSNYTTPISVQYYDVTQWYD